MQITVQVPTALIVALNGLLVVFVVAIDYPRRQARRRLQVAEEPAEPNAHRTRRRRTPRAARSRRGGAG